MTSGAERGLRVLVCGGRSFYNYTFAFEELKRIDAERGISCIISGMAPGADMIGAEWAWEASKIVLEFPADWARYGKAAGPIRNQRMIDEGQPDLVVAFPGGSGTADMVRRAKRSGIQVIEIIYD